jgi:CRISPR-associated protein Cmr1
MPGILGPCFFAALLRGMPAVLYIAWSSIHQTLSAMHTITFECETITPMFLSGADGSTPELRPPSIKGALRFWWRAMNGHLDLKTLKEREGEIFGDTGRRSSFSVRVLQHASTEKQLATASTAILPHKFKSSYKSAIQPKNAFQVEIRTDANQQEIEALFELSCLLGGIGGRARRGFGSIQIIGKNGQPASSMQSLQQLLDLLHQVNPGKFYIAKDTLGKDAVFSRFGRSEPYPYIKQIQIGRREYDIPKRVGQASHDTKGEDDRSNNRKYATSLGSGNRLASPIFVSACRWAGQLVSVVTTLHAVPKAGTADLRLQDSFKTKIL